MPLNTFRYAACGGGNVLLDILLYYISYNYILQKKILNLGFVALEPYTAALGMSFMVTFPIGFLLSKYIVFNTSELRGRIQFFRYILIVAINLSLNYFLIKVMVKYMNFYPTVARVFVTIIIVTFSYLSQKHFTFKTAKNAGGIS